MNFSFTLPDTGTIDQGKEKILVTFQGEQKEIYTHDYQEIYSIPGLYEALFHDTLHCQSPEMVCSFFKTHLLAGGDDPKDLIVLDVGAGNGLVAEEFTKIGAGCVLGIDILKEAREAAMRDRPRVYRDYFILDLTRPDKKAESRIARFCPNCLSVVASLGFDDMPAKAFLKALDMISRDGWVVFNLKEEFLENGHPSGFAGLISRLADGGEIEILGKKRYLHRYCTDGTPLFYHAFVAKKIPRKRFYFSEER